MIEADGEELAEQTAVSAAETCKACGEGSCRQAELSGDALGEALRSILAGFGKERLLLKMCDRCGHLAVFGDGPAAEGAQQP